MFFLEIIQILCELQDSNSEYNKGKSQHCDFLDILLMARDEDEHGLSELEIRDEVDTFLFEGCSSLINVLSVIYNTR